MSLTGKTYCGNYSLYDYLFCDKVLLPPPPMPAPIPVPPLKPSGRAPDEWTPADQAKAAGDATRARLAEWWARLTTRPTSPAFGDSLVVPALILGSVAAVFIWRRK